MAEPLEIVAAAEALLRRSRAAHRQARPRHFGPDQPSRSIRCASSPTARRASRATPSPRLRRQPAPKSSWCSGPVNLPDPPGLDRRQSRDRAADARRRREGAAGRRRHLRRRGRRLAHRGDERAARSRNNKASMPTLKLVENPDILATIAHRKSGRPRLVIGFAAETDRRRRQCQGEARQKRLRLDSRQRRFAADRHHGRRHQHDSPDHRGRRRSLAAAVEGRCRAHAGRSGSPRRWQETNK